MITIPELVDRMIARAPYLEEALEADLLNLSAVARRLRPEIEEKLGRDVSQAAIVMALRRLAVRLQPRRADLDRTLAEVRDMTLRSGLVEFTFRASDSLLDRQRALLLEMAHRRDGFVAFSQGVTEVTLIVSRAASADVERLFADERQLARLDALSAITVRLPEQAVSVPGVHYALLKQLAWNDINVVEVVSTYTELSIVLADADVDRAFAALKSLLWR